MQLPWTQFKKQFTAAANFAQIVHSRVSVHPCIYLTFSHVWANWTLIYINYSSQPLKLLQVLILLSSKTSGQVWFTLILWILTSCCNHPAGCSKPGPFSTLCSDLVRSLEIACDSGCDIWPQAWKRLKSPPTKVVLIAAMSKYVRYIDATAQLQELRLERSVLFCVASVCWKVDQQHSPSQIVLFVLRPVWVPVCWGRPHSRLGSAVQVAGDTNGWHQREVHVTETSTFPMAKTMPKELSRETWRQSAKQTARLSK